MRQPEVRVGEVTIPSSVSVSPEASRRRVRSRAAGALIAASLMSGACYQYVPVSAGAVAPKDEVRLRLTEDAAARISKDLGVYSTQIDGQFSRQGTDSVSLGIPIDRTYLGTTIGTTTQTVYLGRSEVLEIRERKFSRGRTILFSAGVVAGFGLLAASISQLVDPNGPPDDHPIQPPPPDGLRRSTHHVIVRIPIP